MKSSNPAFSASTFKETIDMHHGAKMTYDGVMQKTGLLLLLVILSGSYVWNLFMADVNVTLYLWGGLIAGFVFALITIFNKKTSMYTAPLYALAEGLALGGLSAMMESLYPGIAFQAILGTFAVFALMLFLYKQKVIQATPRFQKVMLFAVTAVFITYLAGFIIDLFGTTLSLFGNGIIGIAFTAIVAGIAAFMLILDFARIEEGVKLGAPKYMEWYTSFGLLVTLVWLYIEILKLFAKLKSRN